MIDRIAEIKERYGKPKLNYSNLQVMADISYLIDHIEKLNERANGSLRIADALELASKNLRTLGNELMLWNLTEELKK